MRSSGGREPGELHRLLRLNYDGNPLDVLDGVNSILRQYGIEFVDDDRDHDGYTLSLLTVTDCRKLILLDRRLQVKEDDDAATS